MRIGRLDAASTLLLTPPDDLHPAAAGKLEANKIEIESVNFLGGLPALGSAVESQVNAILAAIAG